MVFFGLMMVGSASAPEALRDFGDKFYYFKLQLIWLGIGSFLFLIFYRLPLKVLKNLSFPFLAISLFFLILVLIPGLGVKVLGARRWLSFGPIRFQPAELTKLSFILWGAAYLSSRKKILPFFLVLGLLSFLILVEPDLGTTIILAVSGMVLYFISGAPIVYFFFLGLAGALSAFGLIFTSSYRRERFLTFLNPERDPLGASYHIRQILLALGSGGVFGLGFGHSRQKHSFIPAVTTDSIFAIIAEEMGFLGALALIVVYFLLFWRGFRIAKEAPDDFSSLLASGLIFWLALQVLVNLGAMVAVLPLTGIPLPFVSYGGSSLVLNLISVAILANISRERKIIKHK